MTTFEVTCSKCNGPIDFLYGDPTQPVCAGCHRFGYRCKCLAGPERPKVAAEAEQAVADRLRTALAALVAEIDHEAKYGAGLIYTWVHESNMQEARDALVASGQGGEK